MILASIMNNGVRQHNLRLAVTMMMISVSCYAVQDVFVKLLPPSIHVMQICFLRAVFALIPIVAFGMIEKAGNILKTQQWSLHFWRSVFSSLALFCFIASFRLIPLADAYTLTFSCPLFMTALCIPMLKEKVPFWRWIAVLTGFSGVLIMMRPGTGVLDIGGIFALVGGFFYAVSLIYVRKLSHHHQDSNTLIVLTFTLMSALLSLPFQPFVWQPLDGNMIVKFMAIGILGGTAQFAMTQAFRLAPVSKIGPFDYAALLWAVAFGYLFFGDVPDIFMVLGAILIVGSGFLIMSTEKNAA